MKDDTDVTWVTSLMTYEDLRRLLNVTCCDLWNTPAAPVWGRDNLRGGINTSITEAAGVAAADVRRGIRFIGGGGSAHRMPNRDGVDLLTGGNSCHLDEYSQSTKGRRR